MPKTCCCGCSLRTGAIIIASLGMVGSILYMVLAIMLVTGFADTTQHQPDLGLPVALGTISVISFGLNLGLLVGAYKGIRSLVSIWFWVNCLFLALGILGIFIAVILGNTGAFSSVLSIVLGIYFLYVVYGLMEELEYSDGANPA